MPVCDADKLNGTDELMLRQVHPNLMNDGRLWSGAFTPTKSDNGLLSADRETLIKPQEAYERYLTQKKLSQGGGVWGVSIGELRAIGLICYADPVADNEAHALVDFASAGVDNEKGLGKLAYLKAVARGRLFP
jgi:hypothetical protein